MSYSANVIKTNAIWPNDTRPNATKTLSLYHFMKQISLEKVLLEQLSLEQKQQHLIAWLSCWSEQKSTTHKKWLTSWLLKKLLRWELIL